MGEHRLALCSQHYPEWIIQQTQETIRKYKMFNPSDRILVAVSGGKDSLTLWDVLFKLGYSVDGIYINLGIRGESDYSNRSETYCQSFAASRGLKLQTVNISEKYGESISEMSYRKMRSQEKPCSVCGLLKRYVLNKTASDGKYDVIVTGHNLDDEAAILLANTLEWKSEMLRRQSPVLPAEMGFTRKTKPFCRFYERETAAYALIQGIDFIEEECPHSENSKQLFFKNILNGWEIEHPGRKFQFYATFLNARKDGLFTEITRESPRFNDHCCPNCGQPTTSVELCAFCRLIKDPADAKK